MPDLVADAKRALASLDLTNLNEPCSAEDVRDLCVRASTPFGPVAAVCVWPEHVGTAKNALQGSKIKIATVVSFPGGDDPVADVAAMTERAVADGADEIDLVIPYQALLEGREEVVFTRVRRIKRAAGVAQLKAILETGVLQEEALIRRAGELAIEGGADFIKTSTGKVAVNATLRAARIMLETIRESGQDIGFKPAGGVKTTEDAANYLAVADKIMGPDWATPARFRFGASSVLDALLATLAGAAAPVATTEY